MRLTTFTVKKLKSVNGEVNSARNNKKEEEEKFLNRRSREETMETHKLPNDN